MAATRRLVAIMFTDMVGYTASTQTDETGTLELLQEQEGLVRPLFAEHRGREVKSTGDGFLVEFDSALHAVRCAIEILERLHDRNTRPGVSPIRLRIGVHLGDVEERGSDIFGDAVNIASRIEPLAVPGGVCVSGEVFSQVRNKIPNRFERLPPTKLRDVRLPIELYRVLLPWEDSEPPRSGAPRTRLAVLPLANISPEMKDDYFAEGLTEELISTLSKLRDLTVIARTSVGQYKSSTKTIAEIGSELGVGSVLEGSVRKSGNRLRITLQLIDAGTQGHLWASSFDRDLDDVFAVQTEIAEHVAEALKTELRSPEAGPSLLRRPVRADSYLEYLKGRAQVHDESKAALDRAREHFEHAVSLDPQNAAAYSGLADVTRLAGWRFPEGPRAKWDEAGRQFAARAIEIDPNLAEAHASMALVFWDGAQYRAAESEFQLALSLNPSYSLAHYWYGAFLEEEKRAEEAMQEFLLAEQADPFGPGPLFQLALLLTWLGRFDEALVKIGKLGELDPTGFLVHTARARYHLARSELAECLTELQQAEASESDSDLKPVHRALYCALSGQTEEARSLLRQQESLPNFGRVAYSVGRVYAELGDLDSCLRALEAARVSGLIPLQQLQLDPRLAHLRGDPRFQALLKRMNFP